MLRGGFKGTGFIAVRCPVEDEGKEMQESVLINTKSIELVMNDEDYPSLVAVHLSKGVVILTTDTVDDVIRYIQEERGLKVGD